MNLMGEIKSLVTGKPIFDNAIFLKRESDAKKDLELLGYFLLIYKYSGILHNSF